jgi:enoyl-CoA hydratase/carnithine racemase
MAFGVRDGLVDASLSRSDQLEEAGEKMAAQVRDATTAVAATARDATSALTTSAHGLFGRASRLYRRYRTTSADGAGDVHAVDVDNTNNNGDDAVAASNSQPKSEDDGALDSVYLDAIFKA